MNRLLLAAIFLFAGLGGARAQEASPPEPFASEIHLFDIEDEIYPPTACQTLFVGSSSIRFWSRLAEAFPDRKTVRRGFGGATIEDVIFYFERLVLRHQPAAIIFYAGENDINAGRSPEAVRTAFGQFMERKSAALGETPVYFVAIKPSFARKDDFTAQSLANALIEGDARERADLVFIDVVADMMEDGGPKEIFIRDGLHMNEAGYEIWRKAIGRALKKEKTSRAPQCK